MKKFLFVLLGGCSLLAHATGLPDLGDASQEIISPLMERQIGEQSMFQIRADKSYLDDPEIADYLNQLGYRLVANSDEPSSSFEFFAINSNVVNAFAMPGGFIGVNTGLIQLAQSESELASVLSHEIAHVTQHHIARQLAGQRYDSLGAMAALAVAILAARNNPQAATGAIVSSQAAVQQRQLNFTRTHEQEADRIGLGILEKSGFDTRAMPAFFEQMQRATQLLEGSTPVYLRTHPVTADRIADVSGRVQQTPFHLVPDSLDFQLVRAKLYVMQKRPEESITFFSDALGDKKFGNPLAQRYGLILALMQQKNYSRAASEFSALQQQAPANAMIDTLHGQIKIATRQDRNISDFYHKALRNFPRHRALVYDYATILLDNRQYGEALKLLNQQILAHSNDAMLYDLQARTFGALGRHQEEHHALAYNYLLHGNLRGGIEQLELAKQAGNDYYELSTIESELKQFREIAEAQRKKN